MHMDVFNDDVFSAVTMTTALEDYEFKPNLIGSMNLFEDVITTTEKVSVERRGNTLSIIQTSMRGEPIAEGKKDGRSLMTVPTVRIAKGTRCAPRKSRTSAHSARSPNWKPWSNTSSGISSVSSTISS
jgi:hypothetical protein